MREVDRRTLLGMGGAAIAVGLAGCESSDPGAETSTDGTGTATRTAAVQQTRCPQSLEPQHEGADLEYLYDLLGEYDDAIEDVLESATSAFSESSGHTVQSYPVPNHLRPTVWNNEDRRLLFEWEHHRGFTDGEFWRDVSGQLRVDGCQYADAAWEAVHHDGQIFGLPVAASTTALLYNEDAVSEPPETLDEMVDAMAAYHDPDAGQYGLDMPITPHIVSGFAQAYGGDIYDGESEELGLTNDEVRNGLRIVRDELDPYRPDTDAHPHSFADGNAAFKIAASSALDGTWDQPSVRESGVEYGVTTMPALPDGGTFRPYTDVIVVYFGTNESRPREDKVGAREFAEWYTTSERWQLDAARRVNRIPVLQSLRDDDRLPEDQRAFTVHLQDAVPIPKDRKMRHVWSPFGEALDDSINGDADLEEALGAADEAIRNDWEAVVAE